MVCTGYRDFTLRVESAGNGGLRVRYDGSERVSHEVTFLDPAPVREWKATLTRCVFSPRRPGCLTRDVRATERRAGEHLFELLFRGKVKERYIAARTAAENRPGQGLRLRLVFDLTDSEGNASELAALPWELLRDPELGDWLARSGKTPVVRVIDTPRPVAEPTEPPLSILAVEASPSDLDALELTELRHLEAQLGSRGDVTLECLTEGTYEAAVERLRENDWHAFHFTGHGHFDTDSGEGCLVFEDPRRRSRLVRAEQLADELAEQLPRLRLVFLSACESARFAQDEPEPWGGLATALVRKGIPAVVAMQLPITSRAASRFAAAFYDSLAGGDGFESAVAQGRREISDGPEWATPALYLRGSNGRFLDAAVVPAPEMDAPPPSEPVVRSPSAYRPSRRAIGSVSLALLLAFFILGPWVPRRALPATWTNPPECPSPPDLNLHMELIEPGSFVKSSDDSEGPPRLVEIEHPFCIGVFEVTREQWWKIMEPEAGPPSHPDFPREGVSFDAAEELVRRLNERLGGDYFRLPTSAEWEYVARAGTSTDYSFGDDLSLLPRYGNCLSNAETGEDGHDKAIRVGSLAPNEWGIYDVHGNLFEWVSDGAPSEEEALRRGGSYESSPDNCRAAGGKPVLRDRAHSGTGLRLVREPVTANPD